VRADLLEILVRRLPDRDPQTIVFFAKLDGAVPQESTIADVAYRSVKSGAPVNVTAIVTNREVVLAKGMLGSQVRFLPLDSVESIKVKKRDVYLRFKESSASHQYGALTGHSGSEVILCSTPEHAQEFAHALMRKPTSSTTPPAATIPTSSSTLDQLERLVALRAAGGISDHEFDSLKAQILLVPAGTSASSSFDSSSLVLESNVADVTESPIGVEPEPSQVGFQHDVSPEEAPVQALIVNDSPIDQTFQLTDEKSPAALDSTNLPTRVDVSPLSPKSRAVATVLCVLLGLLGVHRFYVGKIGTGILQILTFGGLGIWVLIDLILILCGVFKDKQRRTLSRW